MGPSLDTWNCAIHTGVVCHRSSCAMVYSPKTSANVSTVAESKAGRMFGSITRHIVLRQLPPSDRDASVNVLRSIAPMPASSDRYTKGIARITYMKLSRYGDDLAHNGNTPKTP